MDSFVETPDGAGTIISMNTLREKVRVRLDSEPDTLKTYHNSEIRVIRSGKGKRPEGYVEPPREELAKLRKVTESPEEQYRREQAELAAALDDFLAESGTHRQEGRHGSHEAPRRRRGGDRGRNAEKAEKALEAAVEREKEKQENRNRSRRRRGGQGKKDGPAAETGKTLPQAEPTKEAHKEPAEGKKEGTSRRRHRGGRGRGHGSGGAAPQADHGGNPQAPKPQQRPAGDHGSAPKAEGGEKKGRPNWHRRNHRRSGGGKGTPPAGN